MPGDTKDGTHEADDPTPDVIPAFEMLRAAQDAETRALEDLLLAALGDERGDVDNAAVAIESAIAQHRAVHEELSMLKDVHEAKR